MSDDGITDAARDTIACVLIVILAVVLAVGSAFVTMAVLGQ